MKIAFVSSYMYYDIIKKLVDSEFDYIDVTFLTYEDYTDVPSVLTARQNEFDAVLFSGYLAYFYCRDHCKQTVIWDYVKYYSSSFANALLMAMLKGYEIKNISVDTESQKDIFGAFREIGIDPAAVSIHSWFTTPDDYTYLGFTKDIYLFHQNNLLNRGVTCCFTSVLNTYNLLKDDGVPVIFVRRSYDVFRRAFYQLYQQSTEKANLQAQIVIILAEIGLPSEYSAIAKDEFKYVRNKLKITEKIYAFAERIQAIVSEVSFHQYLIIMTKEVFDRQTQDFNEFELFEEVNKDLLFTVDFGIGMGKTTIDAKKHAYMALLRAKESGQNMACIVAANSEIAALTSYIKNAPQGKELLDEKLSHCAKKAGISVNRILKLYHAVEQSKKSSFTSQELAYMLGISKRNMDRIIQKLEAASIARVIGYKLDSPLGRPSRIIKLNLSDGVVL